MSQPKTAPKPHHHDPHHHEHHGFPYAFRWAFNTFAILFLLTVIVGLVNYLGSVMKYRGG